MEIAVLQRQMEALLGRVDFWDELRIAQTERLKARDEELKARCERVVARSLDVKKYYERLEKRCKEISGDWFKSLAPERRYESEDENYSPNNEEDNMHYIGEYLNDHIEDHEDDQEEPPEGADIPSG